VENYILGELPQPRFKVWARSPAARRGLSSAAASAGRATVTEEPEAQARPGLDDATMTIGPVAARTDAAGHRGWRPDR
jgi:hypothetical protein